MELLTYSMPHEIPDCPKAVLVADVLDSATDLVKRHLRPAYRNGSVKSALCDFYQLFGVFIYITDSECAAVISMVAPDIKRYINTENITILQHSAIRNPVANHFIRGDGDGFRKPPALDAMSYSM